MESMDCLSGADSYRIQKTVRSAVSFRGVGLHCGQNAVVKIHPAPPNHGVAFLRTDLKKPRAIPARIEAVADARLATSLGDLETASIRIGTVEHILSALFGLGIQNALIEISGPEIPILDGSAAPFIEGILDTGIIAQPFSASILRVLKPIKVYQEGAICELLPRAELRLTTSVDFKHPSIGLQTFALEPTPRAFTDEVARARTFGFVRDLENLRAKKLALGASLQSVLAFTDDGILNSGGMRYSDECVRHKLLDAIGDLALCGSWIQGELVSFRGGHFIHHQLLRALKHHRSHWELIAAEPLRGQPLAESNVLSAPRLEW